jgi:hypothetical protein
MTDIFTFIPFFQKQHTAAIEPDQGREGGRLREWYGRDFSFLAQRNFILLSDAQISFLFYLHLLIELTKMLTSL